MKQCHHYKERQALIPPEPCLMLRAFESRGAQLRRPAPPCCACCACCTLLRPAPPCCACYAPAAPAATGSPPQLFLAQLFRSRVNNARPRPPLPSARRPPRRTVRRCARQAAGSAGGHVPRPARRAAAGRRRAGTSVAPRPRNGSALHCALRLRSGL